MKDINVTLPDDLFEEMEIQATVVSPDKPDLGILILSKGLNQFSREIVIRIYRLKKDKTNEECYSIYFELQAFMFTTYKQAKEFLDKLPNMSALEMLLMLNPKPQFPHLQ